jgi:4-amino-4-deoxy-L-arabinose transferase-like glycosyltransferase
MTCSRAIRTDRVVVGGLALLVLALHLATNGRYGYHGDELYFIACGEHLDFGYVDHAPLIAVWAKLSRMLMGDSLFAIRLAPAITGALAVWLTGAIARRLGGGTFAQGVCALAVVIAPAYLRIGNMLCIPGMELLWWTLASYLVVIILKEERQRLWLLVGVVAGVGLMHKHSMLFWGFGLTAGLLLTSARRCFARPWVWLGGVIAVLIFLPNIIWQIRNDWPTLEFLRIINRDVMSGISPLQFPFGQVLYMNPVSLPIWIAGLVFFFARKGGRPFRAFGWQYVVVLVTLILIKSKIYYLVPIYPVLLAGGAVAIEGRLAKWRARWLRPALVSVMVVTGAALAPAGLPLLPLDLYTPYARTVSLGQLDNIWEIVHDYYFMCGWEEQVAAVAEVYHALPEEDRQACTIVGQSYGRAGAVDLFGPAYGLPKAISWQLSYHLWGYGDASGEVLVTLGVPPELIGQFYDEVTVVKRVHMEHCVPHIQDTPICVCRRPKMPLSDVWASVRGW